MLIILSGIIMINHFTSPNIYLLYLSEIYPDASEQRDEDCSPLLLLNPNHQYKLLCDTFLLYVYQATKKSAQT